MFKCVQFERSLCSGFNSVHPESQCPVSTQYSEIEHTHSVHPFRHEYLINTANSWCRTYTQWIVDRTYVKLECTHIPPCMQQTWIWTLVVTWKHQIEIKCREHVNGLWNFTNIERWPPIVLNDIQRWTDIILSTGYVGTVVIVHSSKKKYNPLLKQ